MYKTCNVVMLPSNEKAHFGDIILTPDTKKLLIFRHQNCTEVAQHLYITSDEEIKAGCWFICNNAAQQCIRVIEGHDYPYEIKNKFNGEIQRHSKHWKGVIIATTDKSLQIMNLSQFGNNWKDIPYSQPSKEFIETYIKAYNEGKQITNVEVEYDGGTKEISVPIGHEDYSKGLEYTPEKLKVNPDNTINIKLINDSRNRSEVVELLIKAMIYANQYHSDELDEEDVNDWIEENL